MGTTKLFGSGGLTRAQHDHADDRAVQRVALVGIVVSIALVVLKAALAYASRSLVVTATAIDSAVDVVGAVVLWVGLRLSTRTTARFPYGLYKIENLLQVVVAVLIFVGAYEIAAEALSDREQPMSIDAWVLVGLVAAVLLTLAYSLYAMRWGKRLWSPALLADGRHRLVDVMSASLALVAVASTYLGLDIDRYAALPILAIVVYSGWELLRDGMKVLLDASVDTDTLTSIRDILTADPLVASVRALTARSAGRYVFLEATLVLRTHDLEKAHAATDRLEHELQTAVPAVGHITLHPEPQPRTDVSVAVPLADGADTLDTEFGTAPHFAFARIRLADGEIVDRHVRDNPHLTVDKQKGLLVAEWLVDARVDVVLTAAQVNKGPAYVLGNAGISIHSAQAVPLDEALAQLAEDLRQRREASGSVG